MRERPPGGGNWRRYGKPVRLTPLCSDEERARPHGTSLTARCQVGIVPGLKTAPPRAKPAFPT